MPTPVRSLRTIRTLSARVDHKSIPYRAYMQITCLEMEKARRGTERQGATRRIAEIDARLREIEVEKAALLKALSEPSPGHAPLPRKGATMSPPRSRGQFRIRY